MADRERITTAGLQRVAKTHLPTGVTLPDFQRSLVARVIDGGYSIHKFSRSFRPPVNEDFVTACLVAHFNDELERAEQRARVYGRLAMGVA